MENTIAQVSKQIKEKSLSPVELTQGFLKKIHEENPTINAFLTVTEEEALKEARDAESDILNGHYRGPLHGIPIGYKDLIETEGIRTTMGSKLYKDYIPEKNAPVVDNLRNAGTITLGKLHTHEFAYGPLGDRSFFGSARNPHMTSKITGGSSSGAGAAVAAGFALAGIGTDTGGSVRIPSAACGVVGLKPTVGKISKEGIYPLSETLDHVGPLTKTVLDNMIVYSALLNSGKAAYTFDVEKTALTLEQFTLKGLTIGIPEAYFLEDVEDEVRETFNATLKAMEDAGAHLVKKDVPNVKEILWAQTAVITSEAYAIHEESLNTRGTDYDPEVYERLVSSKETRGFEYVKAMKKRPSLIQQVDNCFNEVDVFVTPTLPILPTDIDQREIVVNGKTLKVRSALLKNTSPWNYTGHPALSVPNGWSRTGLPIGIQLIGPYNQEELLYKIGVKLG